MKSKFVSPNGASEVANSRGSVESIGKIRLGGDKQVRRLRVGSGGLAGVILVPIAIGLVIAH